MFKRKKDINQLFFRFLFIIQSKIVCKNYSSGKSFVSLYCNSSFAIAYLGNGKTHSFLNNIKYYIHSQMK